jgi:prepilin-type N-terminal cleavage/methylation domain-containing protein
MDRYRGFTLIELIAAMTLGVVLAGATLGVVTQLATSRDRVAAAGARQARRGGLRRLLEMDLATASRWKRLPDGFALETMTALEPGTLRLEHLPVTVSYTIERPIDAPPALIRHQSGPGGASFAEIAAGDTEKIEWIVRSEQGRGSMGRWEPMPEAVEISITDTAGDIQVISWAGGAP